MRLIGSWTTSFRQLISETSLRSGRFAVTCYSLFTSPVTEIKRLEQAPISKHLNSVGVFSSHHFCFLSFVTTQTDASVVLCKSCPHRSLSSGIRNTTIVVTWSLVIQKYLCVLESPERTLLKKILIGVARHDTERLRQPSHLTTVIRGMSLLNWQNYKSIELFENVNPDLIELLKNVRRSDGVRVLVIKK